MGKITPRSWVTAVPSSLIVFPIMSASQAHAGAVSPAIESAKPVSGRLLCLDIFRGLAVAGMIVVDNPGSDDLAYGPIEHAEWNGWTCADFIFPSFLFLVGVSMVYSFAARLQRGESRTQILWHAFKRGLILIAIGLFVNASPLIGLDLHTWRFEGVTQRIALCYFAAAILVLWSSRRGTWIALCACLLGY
jgi:predicted acyltransferase